MKPRICSTPVSSSLHCLFLASPSSASRTSGIPSQASWYPHYALPCSSSSRDGSHTIIATASYSRAEQPTTQVHSFGDRVRRAYHCACSRLYGLSIADQHIDNGGSGSTTRTTPRRTCMVQTRILIMLRSLHGRTMRSRCSRTYRTRT